MYVPFRLEMVAQLNRPVVKCTFRVPVGALSSWASADRAPAKAETMKSRPATCRRTSEKGDRRWPPSNTLLEKLVKEATLDAYGESEQKTGFLTMLEDNLGLPFETKVLGVMVTVERIDLTQADEIVAICRRGRRQQAIPILDMPLPFPPPAGAQWIEAYRRWASPGGVRPKVRSVARKR